MLRSLTEIKAVAVVATMSVDHPTDGGSLAPLSEASPSNIGDASNMVIIGNAFPCDNSGRRKKTTELQCRELSCRVFANAADDLSHAKPPISATCLLDCPHQFEDGFKKCEQYESYWKLPKMSPRTLRQMCSWAHLPTRCEGMLHFVTYRAVEVDLSSGFESV